MANVTLTIDMDRRCIRCGKEGAVKEAHGLCLKCIEKKIIEKMRKRSRIESREIHRRNHD